MEQDFLAQIGNLKAKLDNPIYEADFRNNFQNVFLSLCQNDDLANCALQEKYFAVLSLLKQFNNRHYGVQTEAVNKRIDLTALCRAAVFCSDIMASALDKRIFFLSGRGCTLTACNEKQVLWALLCTLSFAAAHTERKYIGVGLKQTETLFLLSAEWYSARQEPPDRETMLLLQKIAHRHGGAVLFSLLKADRGARLVRLTLSLSKAETTDSESRPSSFSDYVSDLLDNRLSPLYAAFCTYPGL